MDEKPYKECSGREEEREERDDLISACISGDPIS